MSALRSFLCFLAATGSMLSMSMPPQCPGLLATTVVVGQLSERCCCEALGGRCCGAACCPTQGEQDKVPGLPKRADNPEETVAPATSTLGTTPAPDAAWRQSSPFGSALGTASPSLIGLSIRLNV